MWLKEQESDADAGARTSGKWIETTSEHPYLVLEEELANKLIGNDHQNNKNQNQTKSYSNLKIPINYFSVFHNKNYTNFLNINAIVNAAMPSTMFITAGINRNLNVLATIGTITAAPNQPDDRLINKSDRANNNLGSTFNSISQAKWTKVSQIKRGQYVATADGWEKVAGIQVIGRKQTYDLQIEGTHNFVGNDIVAHNTFINNGLNIGSGFTVSGVSVPTDGLAVSGNVGIGTTTANFNLSVAGTGYFSGNLGIGATTSSNKLDVWGNTRTTGTLTLEIMD